ncbi:MAG: transglycosylase SLT domain-containing protein [Gemmobacter sp.]
MSRPAVADPAALRAALTAAQARNWAAADAAAQPAGAVARDLVIWTRLRAGDGRLPEYEDFLRRRGDWPGLALLREKGEAAAARSTTPARVIAWFDGYTPRTPEGAAALAAALRAAGRGSEADRVIAAAWVDLHLTEAQQAALLAAHGPALRAHHAARLDRLLWDDRLAEARRMLPLVSDGWRRLAEARLALAADTPGVNRLIDAVPADLASHPGLAHARFAWRMKKERTADAQALLLERSASAEALGRPEAWARGRAVLARAALRENRPREAYRIAAGHRLTGGGAFADLEFLAGYVALTRLNEPDRARTHFRHLGENVRTPISLSRAAYWEGRAEEAAGRRDAARAAYARAARHQTAFYGLAAAERAGIPLDPAVLGGGAPSDWRGAAFLKSSVAEAGLMLWRAGETGRARQFLLHLAEGLGQGDLERLADMALASGWPNLAVLVAKQAAERGIILHRAYYPDTALLPEGLAVSRPLALAIARRESEFDPAAVSPANARGLMQVLPGTARLMADAIGLPYREAALTTDPAYNARLGAAYLARLRDEFGPALTLVAAGYNAGPGRPRQWIAQFGDPRRDGADPIDWIEMVPFAETRSYIMRVAESLVIYRAKAAGRAGPVELTGLLTGRLR